MQLEQLRPLQGPRSSGTDWRETHLSSIWPTRGFATFSSPKGVVAYKETKNSLIVAGDPVLYSEVGIFDDFLNWARDRGKSVSGYYFSDAFAGGCERDHGMLAIQAGVTRSLNFSHWSLGGKAGNNFRRALNFGSRNHYEFIELSNDVSGAPSSLLRTEMLRWVASRPYELGFLLGSPTQINKTSGARHFVVRKGREVLAYASIHSYNNNYYVDHFIRKPRGARMAMDFLLSEMSVRLYLEGVESLNLGFCPFYIERPKGLYESILSRCYSWFPGFSGKGLYEFKKKFTNTEESQYILLDKHASIPSQIFEMSRVTFCRANNHDSYLGSSNASEESEPGFDACS